MTVPVYIEDIVGAWVTTVQGNTLATIQANETAALGSTSLINTINFQFGPGVELIETFQQDDKSPNAQTLKYPLVWLVTDITETRGKLNGIFAQVKLHIYICHQTKQTYKSTERAQYVFKPVLDPIYYALITAIANDAMVNQGTEDLIPHDRTKRYFLGNANNSKNALNDYVDAIEINNLAISINYQSCL